MARHPATDAKVIPADQQNQSNESAKDREVNHLIAIDGKATVIDREGVQKALPAAQHRKQVHDQQASVREIPKHAKSYQKAQRDLNPAAEVNLRQADIDPIEMPRKVLVLLGRDDLMRRPEKNEPRQPKPKDKQGKRVKFVLRR